MKAPKVNITKGGNKGGRRTAKKFGDEPNSILNTLQFMDPEVRRKFRENKRRLDEDHRALEIWAARDFMSDGRSVDVFEEA